MKRLKKAPALLVALQLVVGSFTPLLPRMRAENLKEAVAEEGEGPSGLKFRLSEAPEQAERPAPRGTPAPAEKLSDTEVARVLQRLPPLKTEAGDEQDFALREGSLPPPRAGATVLNPFPAPDERRAPDVGAAGAPEVLRRSPEGEVPLAPQVSVTFSQPMVAVTSQEEAAREVPVTMTPSVPGRWRWLGTKTLIFDPADNRLPMATDFTVTVPAGARSASGAAVKAPVSWKFSTPPPKLARKFPEGGPVRRDPVVFIEFDQKIDPEAVLRKLTLRAG
ncbi:MAG TPA: Ig-like domain-containing protein, partial [Pyrinomonadaceae bacterium]|nr:Ig-like domain-containing protein [Pyrinomonadaceae bacterium]